MVDKAQDALHSAWRSTVSRVQSRQPIIALPMLYTHKVKISNLLSNQ